MTERKKNYHAARFFAQNRVHFFFIIKISKYHGTIELSDLNPIQQPLKMGSVTAVTDLINNKAVCRTAPAIPGLLISWSKAHGRCAYFSFLTMEY